jgi:glycosyltransferase involved in cell wall biosynthesis
MRIAYVSLHWPRTRNSGVGKKIHSQIQAWNARGHGARLFMHSVVHEPRSDLIDGEYFFYRPADKIRTELHRMAAMSQMIEAIRSYRPDLIYLRYSMYIFPAHRLMDIAPVVEEINTDDLSQHEQLGPIYSLYNRYTRGIFLRRVRGIAAVSHELAISPAFSSFGKPTVVIANGIDLDSIRPLPAPKNETPRLFFIATPGYSWHGIDKLVALARMCPDLTVDVVGYDRIEQISSLPANIHLHGYLSPERYVGVLSRADLAVSTLALHRKNMQEASPLKTRECLGYGLPMVLAYKDTDLEGAGGDFLLKIPNKEDNIQTHANLIREFAYRMRGRRADRELLKKTIDTRQKEAMRLAFFEEILQKPA